MNVVAIRHLLLLQQIIIKAFQTTIIVMNRSIYKKLVRNLKVKSGDSILDVSCGDGLAIKYLLKKHKNIYVDGITYFEQSQAKAFKKNHNYIASGRVDVHCTSIDDFTPNRLYDKIFGINAIYFWSNPDLSLKKVVSWLNQDGELVLFLTPSNELHKFMSISGNDNKYPIREIIIDLKKEGLNNIEVRRCKTKFGNGIILIANKRGE